MQALYTDNGAGGAWLPALEIVSDAGIVTGRYVGSSVAAGSDQEVTFHPLGSKGAASAAGVTGLPNALIENSGTFTIPANSVFTVPLSLSVFATTDAAVFDVASNQIKILATGLYAAYAHLLFQTSPPVSMLNLAVTWTNSLSPAGEWVTPRRSSNAQSGFSGEQPNNDAPLTSDYLDNVSWAYVGYATVATPTAVKLVVVNYDTVNPYSANAFLSVVQLQPIAQATVQTFPTFP